MANDFRSGQDASNELNNAAGEAQPALLFNPHAELDTVLSAAMGRASNLHRLLLQWGSTDSERAPTAPEVASAMEPLAEEICLLLGEVQRRFVKRGSK